MIKLTLWLLLLLLSGFAQAAEEYAKPRFYTQWLSQPYFDTQEAACSAGAQKAVETSGTVQSAVVSYAGGGRNALGSCIIKYTPFNQTGTGIVQGSMAAVQTCPAGYTLGASTVNIYQRICSISTCPAGTTLNTSTNRCDDDCLPLKGKPASFALNCGSSEPSAVCMPNNCAANISASFSVRTGNCSYGTMSGIYTGSKCSGQVSSASLSNPSNANPPPADLPETDCIKKGMSYGTVNGSVACVPKGTAGSAAVKESASTSTSTKDTDASGNSTSKDESSSTATTRDGDNVTTVKTTNNADGSKKEETKTQPFEEFCTQNPNHKLCKSDDEKESKFEGDCAANFVCEGDKVQCAMALKQHLTYCENTKNNSFSDIFDTQKSAADALMQSAGSILPSSTVNIPSVIQGQKLLSSGGLSDISFPVAGQAIVLPLSKLNSALEFAGQMVLIISYLISAYILFGHKGAQ